MTCMNGMIRMNDSGDIYDMTCMTGMNGIDNMTRMCYIDGERGKHR